MQWSSRLVVEVAVVVFGIGAGILRLAAKDFRAYREKRRVGGLKKGD